MSYSVDLTITKDNSGDVEERNHYSARGIKNPEALCVKIAEIFNAFAPSVTIPPTQYEVIGGTVGEDITDVAGFILDNQTNHDFILDYTKEDGERSWGLINTIGEGCGVLGELVVAMCYMREEFRKFRYDRMNAIYRVKRRG